MITTLDPLKLPPPPPGGAVISIGVFDGVHLGHLAILGANRARARELGAAATVVTFRRHPKKVLLGHEPRTLTSLEHRLELFRRAGVEHTIALSFDERLREIAAEEFVRELLIARLGARAFVLGFDSKFGRDRRGTPELLKAMGLDVGVVGQVIVAGRPVSSTAIREAVELGDLEGARRMLGRRVGVLGTVVRGDELGRRLGFPTANLNLHHELHPPTGVYACFARIASSVAPATGVWPAVANIGTRPTVGSPAADPRVEVHLLGFQGTLYGAQLEVAFVARLRPEQRFPGLDALQAQIARDAVRAKELLASEQPEWAGSPGRG